MFRNKVVIVTGGSAGSGAATAEYFAKEGASVALVGRNETKLNNVVQRCANLGANVLVIKTDVSIDDEAKTIVKRTVDKFSRLDVLVNNAGILRFGTILDSDVLQIYDEVMNTNLRSVVYITNLAVPYLQETKGNVINVSSIASKNVVPGINAFYISNAGINHFTRAAAVELVSNGVRVDSVNPGPVTSDMLQIFDSEIFNNDSSLKDCTVLHRVSEDAEIGNFLLYLDSDKAVSITGSCYDIDNGLAVK